MKPLRDWTSYTFLSEAGRRTHLGNCYSIIHAYTRQDPHWPLGASVLADFSHHTARWYFIVRSSKQFDPFLRHFLTRQSTMHDLEAYLTRARTLTAQNFSFRSLRTATNAELARYIVSYYRQFEHLIFAAKVLRYLDRALVPHLRDAFRRAHDIDAMMMQASISERKSLACEEEQALLQLAVFFRKEKLSVASDLAKRRLAAIARAYGYTSCDYYNGRPKTAAAYAAIVTDMMRNHTEKNLRALKARIQRDRKSHEVAIAHLPQSKRSLGSIATNSTFVKDYYHTAITELIMHARPLFREIARRTHRTAAFVHDLLPAEVVRLLHSGRINERTVAARVRHSIIIAGKGKCIMLTGRNADAFAERYLQRTETKDNAFMGRVASPGKWEGLARVVFGPSDFGKVRRGDVLVVMNTSPEFMPVLRKAGAVVGEEGGLTAHVSVISRELGIPAVVGIPHIVQLLHDGDRVEVDATRGIVRRTKE